MSVIKRENPFVQLNKHFLHDKSLSWKSRGILAYFLSCDEPSDIEDLRLEGMSREEYINESVAELIRCGYLRINGNCLDDSEWEFYDTPQK